MIPGDGLSHTAGGPTTSTAKMPSNACPSRGRHSHQSAKSNFNLRIRMTLALPPSPLPAGQSQQPQTLQPTPAHTAPERKAKTVPCTYNSCSVLSTDVYNRDQHIREHHTGDRPHVCPVKDCGKTFTRPFTRDRHLAQIHGVDVRVGKGNRKKGEAGFLDVEGVQSGRVGKKLPTEAATPKAQASKKGRKAEVTRKLAQEEQDATEAEREANLAAGAIPGPRPGRKEDGNADWSPSAVARLNVEDAMWFSGDENMEGDGGRNPIHQLRDNRIDSFLTQGYRMVLQECLYCHFQGTLDEVKKHEHLHESQDDAPATYMESADCPDYGAGMEDGSWILQFGE